MGKSKRVMTVHWTVAFCEAAMVIWSCVGVTDVMMEPSRTLAAVKEEPTVTVSVLI